MMIYNHTGESNPILHDVKPFGGIPQGLHRDRIQHPGEPSHRWRGRPSRVRRTRQRQRGPMW